MFLHFVFVVKEEDLLDRREEFRYVKKMALFFKSWIRNKFSRDVEIMCDEMITSKRNLLQRLDTHTLLEDHRRRGSKIFHFYMCHFRPMWTDCTCEGYYAENFGMMFWHRPAKPDDYLFLAEKNCTVVSHVLAHELLRQAGYKKYDADVHDIWTKHLFADMDFEQYGANLLRTVSKPLFLTIDLSSLDYADAKITRRPQSCA